MLAKRKNYSDQHPNPTDILLLVEVADSSLADDRGYKADLYAEAGIADYWIVNLIDRCVEVYRDPRDGKYQNTSTFHDDQSITPLAFPEASFLPSMVFVR